MARGGNVIKMGQITLANKEKTANLNARDAHTEKKLQKVCDESGLHAATLGNILVGDKRYYRLVEINS